MVLSCTCSLLFQALKSVFKAETHQGHLIGYLLIIYLYFGLGVLGMLLFTFDFTNFFKEWVGCGDIEDNEESCYGASLLFRISFILALIFLLLFLLMWPRDDFSYMVNKNCWYLKFLFPIFLIMGSYVIPNGFFKIYGAICKYLGLIYLFMQNMAFAEFFFRWGTSWKDKADKRGFYKIGMTTFSILSFFGVVTLLVVGFALHWGEGCWGNRLVLIFNTIMVIILYLLTFAGIRDDVTLISTSFWNLYTTYYYYSSVAGDIECSDVGDDWWFVPLEIIISIILVTIVVAFLAYARNLPIFEEEGTKEAEGKTKEDIKYEEAVRKGGNEEDEKIAKLEYRTYKYVWIMATFIFLCFYFINVINNWGRASLFGHSWSYSNDNAGYYIKLLNGFLCTIYYFTVLTLPLCCKKFKFGREASDPKTEYQ